MALGRPREERGLAGFAAEAQPPMIVSDETELSTTVVAAVVHLVHETLLRPEAHLPVYRALPFGTVTDLATHLVASSGCNLNRHRVPAGAAPCRVVR
jgi:hypothetical protein